MSPPYLSGKVKYQSVLFSLCVGCLLIAAPATATLYVTGESLNPPAPLVSGQAENAVITLTLVPSGATSFPRSHTLQMQTSLVDAQWNIQIIQNGRAAATQTASGTAAFINGYLLSYPTTSDLSLTITLNGTVPPDAGTNVTILQVAELDNAGTLVPGSSLTVSAPLTSPSPVLITPTQVTDTTPLTATSSPTQSAGALPVTGLIASVVAAAGYVSLRSRRK